MKSIPNPVGLVILVGLTVTATNALTAPGDQIIALLAGLIVTALLAGIFTLGLWARARYSGPSN